MSYCKHRDCKLWVKEIDIYCKEHDKLFRKKLNQKRGGPK